MRGQKPCSEPPVRFWPPPPECLPTPPRCARPLAAEPPAARRAAPCPPPRGAGMVLRASPPRSPRHPLRQSRPARCSPRPRPHPPCRGTGLPGCPRGPAAGCRLSPAASAARRCPDPRAPPGADVGADVGAGRHRGALALRPPPPRCAPPAGCGGRRGGLHQPRLYSGPGLRGGVGNAEPVGLPAPHVREGGGAGLRGGECRAGVGPAGHRHPDIPRTGISHSTAQHPCNLHPGTPHQPPLDTPAPSQPAAPAPPDPSAPQRTGTSHPPRPGAGSIRAPICATPPPHLSAPRPPRTTRPGGGQPRRPGPVPQ